MTDFNLIYLKKIQSEKKDNTIGINYNIII